MPSFGYEKPTLKEVTADELRSFGVSMLSGGGGAEEPADALAESLFRQVGFAYSQNAGYVYWLRALSDRLDAVYGGLDAEERAWMFFRIIGGFCYGDNDPYGGMKWIMTAGALPYTCQNTSKPPSSEVDYFTGKLGFGEKAYRLFRYYTRAQHSLCGGGFDPDKHSNEYSNNFREAMGDCLAGSDRWLETGEIISVNSAVGFLRAVNPRMVGKVDFAHMCITAASTLATDCAEAGGPGSAIYTYFSGQFPRLCSLVDPDTAREYMAGWLGDAVLLGGEGKTSFGADDYKADLDAVDIVPKIRRRYTSLGALEACLTSGRSRRSRFLDKVAAADALACMNRGVYTHADTSDEFFLGFISESDKYADTYRFYRILVGEAGEP